MQDERFKTKTDGEEQVAVDERPGEDAKIAEEWQGDVEVEPAEDDGEDEVAPIGNRRSEPPTSDGPAAQRAGVSGRGGKRRGAGGRSSSLPADDPFWQFGTPVELWGSTKASAPSPGRSRGGRGHGRSGGARYLECRHCGVKIEPKRAARRGRRTPCPMCGRFMSERS